MVFDKELCKVKSRVTSHAGVYFTHNVLVYKLGAVEVTVEKLCKSVHTLHSSRLLETGVLNAFFVACRS